MKALRSILYSPGHKPKMIEKAPSYGADALCLVVEDSVPDELKQEARLITREAIGTLAAQGQTVFVKVNDVDRGEVEADANAIVRPGLAGIILPKTKSPEDVRLVDQALTAAEVANGVAPGTIEIILLMETPLAIVRAFEIITASPRVASAACGGGEGGDLARELGLSWTPEGLERIYLRSKVLTDARAAGIQNPFDGAFVKLNDPDGLVQEATDARRLGYRGKLAVHPKQIEPINRVFTPTAKEVEYQRRVLEAFDQALAGGAAALVVDGKFIDYAMATTAKRIIQLADAVGVREGD